MAMILNVIESVLWVIIRAILSSWWLWYLLFVCGVIFPPQGRHRGDGSVRKAF